MEDFAPAAVLLSPARRDQAGTTLRVHRPAPGGSIMSKDSTTKANVKKKGKTTKEKQTAKRLKRDEQNGRSSNIVPTGR
ncbi:hypothetical protein AB0F59_22265 [Micromonospora lupini]|uniref:hypothetical protein n=1 Tax=Micromonospora lupini TaxID=285679 RepID=UPI0034016133